MRIRRTNKDICLRTSGQAGGRYAQNYRKIIMKIIKRNGRKLNSAFDCLLQEQKT